jgi:2-hydroxy-3-keto-5-methylthiopentenyl-1-phosphate phosphatase
MSEALGAEKVLVTDFDGTMTKHDFYQLAIETCIPSDCPNYWDEYRAGRMTHFVALQSYFHAIRASELEISQLIDRMEFDPGAGEAISRLQEAGWRVIIASAGCDWYIRRLLSDANVDVPIHANPGRFYDGSLHMELPTDRTFYSPELGVDKVAVVRDLRASGIVTSFAGDGYPDVEPAKVVEAPLRFARGDLARVLSSQAIPYHSFYVWSDIADQLIAWQGA